MASLPPARQNLYQVVNYLRKSVAYNTANIGTGGQVLVGVLPAGALVAPGSFVYVGTAFNAATTNVLTVGTNGTTNNDIFAAADVTEGTPGSYKVPDAGLIKVAADTPVYAKYTQSGTAATAGAADIVIAFIPNIDG